MSDLLPTHPEEPIETEEIEELVDEVETEENQEPVEPAETEDDRIWKARLNGIRHEMKELKDNLLTELRAEKERNRQSKQEPPKQEKTETPPAPEKRGRVRRIW